MADELAHRGPDDLGYYISEHAGLGMRRLAIIDVAGGHQPISNEDGTVWIVFNGEIYNYRELAEGLTARGHRLRTRSDTEVILHLYEDHGRDCVQRLNGMFAFAIYDTRPDPDTSSGKLLLARDRVGKKPLYFSDQNGMLLFGSELKAILRAPGVSRDLDFEALHHYLSLLVVPAPWTIFKDIRKLPPGHVLECDASGSRIASYWACPFPPEDSPCGRDEGEVEAEIRRLFFQAVEKRLISEVPLGAFLSGGLDSSAVVAAMSRLKAEPVKTFSIGFEGPETHNELPYARRVAKHCGADHREFLVKPDIVRLLPELVHFFDEPFAVSSAIPTYLLARAARERVTVVLTGDGGDETFGGYAQYIYEQWAKMYRRLPAFVDRPLASLAGLAPGRADGYGGRLRSRLSRFVRNARLPVAERRLGWASGFSEGEKARLYTPSVRALVEGRRTADFLERQSAGVCDPILRQMAMDFRVWLPDEMLTKVDRMTMASSVEARCPLLDVSLIEYVSRIPFAQRVPGSRTKALKHLMRRSLADLLPPDLLGRRKQGFNVPLDAWFRAGARPFIADALHPDRVRRRGVFEPEAVAGLLEAHWAGERNLSNRLYALLAFEVWAEAYL
jgi:asparagine synthase (glutamine-hydrolysing)